MQSVWGYEKGHIENKVGYIRRNLFVPPPTVDDLCALNRELLDRSEQHWSRLHYKKGQPVVTLFAEDRAHWRALPADAFAARYTRVRATRQGMFHLDGPHWYSSAPEQANQLLVVRIGAHTVTPMTLAGQPITTHARIYGSLRSDSTDYRTTVHQLSQKLGAWRNSLLREALPETVRTALDEALRPDLKTALEALAHCTDRWGFDHAVRALGMVFHLLSPILRDRRWDIHAKRVCPPQMGIREGTDNTCQPVGRIPHPPTHLAEYGRNTGGTSILHSLQPRAGLQGPQAPQRVDDPRVYGLIEMDSLATGFLRFGHQKFPNLAIKNCTVLPLLG